MVYWYIPIIPLKSQAVKSLDSSHPAFGSLVLKKEDVTSLPDKDCAMYA